ncbi:MAG: HAMP domain-containing protein, partial [Hyphomicrobiales bacterium]|nr:HAMP domain-containing protein [Hyphomicrobiales bacterium]
GLSLVLFREVKQPFSTLIALGEHMLQGHFIESSEFAGRNSLFAQLSAVFVKFSRYLQEMTSLTQDIAGGKLDAIDVQKRSRRDPLGTALQDMLKYLRLVAESAQKISEGQVHISIPLRAETDQFGKTLHQMLKYLDNMAAVATAISEGDLRGEIRPLSERDVLGTAFDHMTHYLNTLAAAAATIASGDLSRDIQPVTEHDALGNAFQVMARQLRENFEKIRQEVAARTTAQEALQRLNEELEQRVIERTAEITR